MEPLPVRLHVYDVSRGIASRLSPVLLGREVSGLWHTNVVVGDTEISYGPPLSRHPPGAGPLGAPDRVLDMGETALRGPLLDDLLTGLARGRFTERSYNILTHNCNTFAHELLGVLTGGQLPSEYLSQPQEWLDCPLGERLMGALGRSPGPAAASGAGTGGGPSASPQPPAKAPTVAAETPSPGAADAPEALLSDLLRGLGGAAAEGAGGSAAGAGPAPHATIRALLGLWREAAEALGGDTAAAPATVAVSEAGPSTTSSAACGPGCSAPPTGPTAAGFGSAGGRGCGPMRCPFPWGGRGPCRCRFGAPPGCPAAAAAAAPPPPSGAAAASCTGGGQAPATGPFAGLFGAGGSFTQPSSPAPFGPWCGHFHPAPPAFAFPGFSFGPTGFAPPSAFGRCPFTSGGGSLAPPGLIGPSFVLGLGLGLGLSLGTGLQPLLASLAGAGTAADPPPQCWGPASAAAWEGLLAALLSGGGPGGASAGHCCGGGSSAGCCPGGGRAGCRRHGCGPAQQAEAGAAERACLSQPQAAAAGTNAAAAEPPVKPPPPAPKPQEAAPPQCHGGRRSSDSGSGGGWLQVETEPAAKAVATAAEPQAATEQPEAAAAAKAAGPGAIAAGPGAIVGAGEDEDGHIEVV